MKLKDVNDNVGVIDRETEKVDVKKPNMYNVILHNDDFTPAEFVVIVLSKFFNFDQQKAISLMIAAHRDGKAIVGTYPKDIAETKTTMCNDFAKQHEQPLMLTIEPAE